MVNAHIEAADAKLSAANARYMAERTPEARAARDDASRERSALGYKKAGYASRAGMRQYREMMANMTRRTR